MQCGSSIVNYISKLYYNTAMDKHQQFLNKRALHELRKRRLEDQREKLTRINTLLLSKPYHPSVLDSILSLLDN